jgi:hypothetical protein
MFTNSLIESILAGGIQCATRMSLRSSGLRLQIVVMPGLVPGIHVSFPESKQDVDGRDKPGHDELRMISNSKRA